MPKYIDMIAWEDSPHLCPPNITQEELDELEGSLRPHQRAARRTGRPSLGAGAIFPIDEEHIKCEPFRIPDHFKRGYGFDVGWRRTAAVFAAEDIDTGIVYLTHEYYIGELEPVTHAHAIKAMGGEWMTGAVDPGADASSQVDGRKLRKEYEGLGLTLVSADNAVESGLFHVLTEMQGGQLKVFSTLQHWWREFKLYRRDDKGKIIKTNDHLMDATRYVSFTKHVLKHKPAPRTGRTPKGEWGR